MTNIFLVRHGETIWNQNCVCQGITNVPLSKQGIKQAQELGEKFKSLGFHFTTYVSSNLSRAYDTCKIIKDILKDKGHIDIQEGLRERDFGDLEGKDFDYVANVINSNQQNKVHDFESNEDLSNRVYNAIMNVVATYPEQNILIVSHSNTIKALLTYIDASKYNYGTKIPNLNVSKLSFEGGILSLDNLYLIPGVNEDKTKVKQ